MKDKAMMFYLQVTESFKRITRCHFTKSTRCPLYVTNEIAFHIIKLRLK